MANIFEIRTFNPEEKTKMKKTVDIVYSSLQEIMNYNESMKETLKDVCEDLNKGITDKTLKVTPKLLKRIATTKLKNNLSLQQEELESIDVFLSTL